jgi:hypothetical protein
MYRARLPTRAQRKSPAEAGPVTSCLGTAHYADLIIAGPGGGVYLSVMSRRQQWPIELVGFGCDVEERFCVSGVLLEVFSPTLPQSRRHPVLETAIVDFTLTNSTISTVSSTRETSAAPEMKMTGASP